MKEVLLDIDEKGVAMVSMNRPHVFNAINDVLVDCLDEVLDICVNDPNVRCIVLSGEGKAFCAGGDLSYLESLDEEQTLVFFKKLGALTHKLYNLPKPVIAMVNGAAAGAGFNIVLACDLVYADQLARFGQSFSKVGLIPDFGGLYLLPKIIGPYRAKQLMFSGELLSCSIAYRMGFINKVCMRENLYEETVKAARQLARCAPLSIKLIKKYVNDDTLTLEQVLDIELAEQPRCMATEDFKEGVAAFKEKRNPRFKGK